jgi:hypothetical protein
MSNAVISSTANKGAKQMHIKPPIGLMPRRIWDYDRPSPSREELKARYSEVKAAMRRFFDAGIEIPSAWKEEAADIILGDDKH